ncbi:hypothetical protein JWH16_04565 [Xanthomonas campestris pv. campestris]|uniref:hypothetical protein n=1 Tax=Xanthomonas campestris TaxID=339 RepID=UPI001E51CF78|nr:hypothetical protein [Xanthomonas campestris]MCD0253128.1 hypothetical protein [Xanthomonas campestris pv. campestris]
MTSPVLSVLANHRTGMRWASESNHSLQLPPHDCRELANEMHQAYERAAELFAAAADYRRLDAMRSLSAVLAKLQAGKRLDTALHTFAHGA